MPTPTDPPAPHGGVLARTLQEHVNYPPHPPRRPTPLYTKSHHDMVVTEDLPCLVCGVRNSDLADPVRRADPAINPVGATQIETHHRMIEDSLIGAIDVGKWNRRVRPVLAHQHPEGAVYDHDFTPEEFARWAHGHRHNLWPLCVAGDTPVLREDGTHTPIGDVAIGDWVIGHDLQAHRVQAVHTRRGREDMAILDGVLMTLNHPILTLAGWRAAGVVGRGMVVRRVAPYRLDALAHAALCPVSHAPSSRLQMDLDLARIQPTAVRVAPVGASALATLRAPSVGHRLAAGPNGSLLLLEGSWQPVRRVLRCTRDIALYDLTVAGSRSFVAGDLAVHNCDVHHRAAKVGIHAITYPIWSVQDILVDGYDLTGYVAHSKEEAQALTELASTRGAAAWQDPSGELHTVDAHDPQP